MSETFLDQAQERAAQSSKKAEQMKEAVTQGIEDFVDKSKHTLKRGRRAAEELAEDYTHRVKKYPLSSVTGGLMTGLVIGVFIGWMIGRRS